MMDVKTAKRVLLSPDKSAVMALLVFVNLTDRENEILIYAMRGITQEKIAEKLNCTTNCIQKAQHRALEKCAAVWERRTLADVILAAL